MTGALVGLLIVMVLLMKGLMEHQVTAAAERRVQEPAIRTAAARCKRMAYGFRDDAYFFLKIRTVFPGVG